MDELICASHQKRASCASPSLFAAYATLVVVSVYCMRLERLLIICSDLQIGLVSGASGLVVGGGCCRTLATRQSTKWEVEQETMVVVVAFSSCWCCLLAAAAPAGGQEDPGSLTPSLLRALSRSLGWLPACRLGVSPGSGSHERWPEMGACSLPDSDPLSLTTHSSPQPASSRLTTSTS
jgi:hypothetical protein